MRQQRRVQTLHLLKLRRQQSRLLTWRRAGGHVGLRAVGYSCCGFC